MPIMKRLIPLLLLGLTSCGEPSKAIVLAEWTPEKGLTLLPTDGPPYYDLETRQWITNAFAKCARIPILGKWKLQSEDSQVWIEFKNDCTGTSSICSSKFSYSKTVETTGNITLKVTEAETNDSCAGPGIYAYPFQINEHTLQISIDHSVIALTKE